MIVKAVQGRRSIKVGRIRWKCRFWVWSERVKEWCMMRVVVMTHMSWQVNEDVSRDVTGEADGMNQGVDSRDGWCISELAICYFQWGDGWWTRKGDNRWGAGAARRLIRDQIVKIARLTGCKNSVGKRRKFMFNAFVDLKPVERFENGSGMWGFRSLNNSTSKRVLDLLEPVKFLPVVW